MKKNIHLDYSHNVTVRCVTCSNTFTTGSAIATTTDDNTEEIVTELCSNCHPFYTGEQRTVDTANKISDFEDKRKKAESFKAKMAKNKKAKELKSKQSKKPNKGLTLKDMLSGLTD